MKKLFLLLAPLTLGLMVGCSSDDSTILDKIAEMEKEHDEMQAQIDAQQKLLDALANKLTITDVTQTSNGYTITLSDGTSMTIKDGEPGDNFIESIEVGEEDVTFTLTDGTVIVIPLGCSSSGSGDTPAENNKIYYTISDNTKLFPTTDASLYGAILISNTYKDGQGVLVFDDAVTKIGDSAFSRCSSLTSVTIPDSVTEIGDYAFYNCDSLQEFRGKFASEDGRCLIIDGTLNSFAPAGLSEYTIPDSVTTIGWAAFKDCSSLTSVTIPDSVTTIGGYAFSDCSSLTSVTIPDSVTTIGEEAFCWCESLTSVYINDIAAWCNISFETSDFNSFNLYLNNELVTDLTIPDSVTTIRDYAFSNCSSLTSVTIGDSVTSIGSYAFEDCRSLTSVTIPDSVTEIGWCAFVYCSSLTSVYCKATTPPAGGSSMFYNNASGRKIYVPMESVEAYKSAEGWSEYKSSIVGYNF